MRPRFSILLVASLLVVPTLAVGGALPGAEPTVHAVTIVRDAYGVPHVYADDAYGLFWGNGYAQAQDRLFQMDVLRHVGKGESARILGPGQLEMDLATRRELYTDAERTARWSTLPAEEQRMFGAFAEGVNAFIRETREDPTKLSAEFYAIGHAPEDWVPEDTIAIAEFLLDIFGAGSGGNELRNAQMLLHLRDTVGEAAAEGAFTDFFYLHDNETPTTLAPSDYTYNATESILDFDDVPAHQWAVVEAAAGARAFAGPMSLQDVAARLGFKFGSNAIVVGPALSESGNALLLGGPQMAYHNPMVPYEIALHGAGFDALGMGVGGAPGVIIGRTPHYAWTVTSGSSDQVDVVAVKLVEGDPRAYHVSGTSGQTAPMDCRVETHVGPPTAVDPNPPVLAVQEVCRTDRGPVFAINEDAGYAFVRERTHRGDELRSGILWLLLSKSADLQAFQDHMETFRFEFNFHVATDAGDIAYFHWGGQPVRDDACDARLPRLAGACDWTGIRTGKALPHVVNPSSGLITNWNNKPALGWSSGDAMEKWGPVHRVRLIHDSIDRRLAVDGNLSIDDLKDVNVDISTRSPFPVDLAPYFVTSARATSDATLHAMADELEAWAAHDHRWADADGDDRYDFAGFAIYERTREHLQRVVFEDDLGPYMREMGFDPPETSDPHAADHGREDNKDNVLLRAFRNETAHTWCSDVDTPVTESCHWARVAAMQAAAAELTAEFGSPDPADWLQDVRKIRFVALSGGPSWEIPMVNRPSFNHYYDFGTGEVGSVLPPGTDQSWAPLDFLRYNADGTFPDPHKRDQLDLYTAFEWKPAQMTPVGVESTRTFAVCEGCLV